MPRDVGALVRNRYAFQRDTDTILLDIPDTVYRHDLALLDDALNQIAAPNLIRVHPDRLLCDQSRARCSGIANGHSLYTDDNHQIMCKTFDCISGVMYPFGCVSPAVPSRDRSGGMIVLFLGLILLTL